MLHGFSMKLGSLFHTVSIAVFEEICEFNLDYRLTLDNFRVIWFTIVMITTTNVNKVYTPEQVAEMLQLSKKTVYELIARGEIVAKKIGRVYRISASSLSFIFTGLDNDLLQAEKVDKKNVMRIQKNLSEVRTTL
jgi:excisionase family DNA binding protein